jgi:peptide/nickel transport system substrate-binding protein
VEKLEGKAMNEGYWTEFRDRRVARRRALALSGGTVLGAGLLTACGNDGPAEESNKSRLIERPADTTKQAERTGVMKDRTFGDPPTLDILTQNNPHNAVGPHVYSSLVQFKPGFLKPSENEVIGDVMESWEWAPDGLSMTMKLRPGIKWHNKPPVSGRDFDMPDVLFSWDRFVRKSSSRGAIANVADPSAPVLSITAPDSKTLLVKLKEPLIYAPGLFTSNRGGGLVMMPRETDTNFDPRGDMIGTGPFLLSNYSPSVSFTLKGHPEYWDKDSALVEEISLPIIPEYASALAQFKAGNIYSMGNRGAGVIQEEILSVKRDEPRLSIYEGDLTASQSRLSFGWLPAGKSPFLDERVRQAISMSLDRDLFIDTFNNVSKFESDGLLMTTRWNTGLAATFEGWWLDPKGKDFGPTAKYFQHDIAEAKKLLAAAGYPSGIKDVTSSYVTGPQLDVAKPAQVIDGMIGEIGITSKVRSVDYGTEYIPIYRDGKGQYEGWAYKTAVGAPGKEEPTGALSSEWWSKGGVSFHGFSASGQNDLSGDPVLNGLIEKARIERDTDRRRALVFDIQRNIATSWYAVPFPGGASGFVMAWPCIGNYRVFQGGLRPNYRLWVDDTKPPFKRG